MSDGGRRLDASARRLGGALASTSSNCWDTVAAQPADATFSTTNDIVTNAAPGTGFGLLQLL